jgi:methyl-accepting chemotaxis protein
MKSITGWFNRLKVRNKFLLIAIFLMPFLLGLGGTGIWGVIQINAILQDVQGEQIPSILNLENMAQKIEAAQASQRLALFENNTSRIQKELATAQSEVAIAQKNLDAYLPRDHGAKENELAKTLDTDWEAWLAQFQELNQLGLQNTAESDQKAQDLLASDREQKVINSLSAIIDFNSKEAEAGRKQANDTFGAVLMLIIGSGIGVLVVFLGSMILLSRSIIGMTNNLSNLNLEISRAVQELNGSSVELMSLVNQQTAGASEQSAAIHQTSSTVNEVKATIEQTNQRSHAMSDTALRSVNVAEEGQLAVSETVSGMNAIKEQVETIAENILALSEQTQQIGEIIASVNDIAEQSNLLALNAAVEAARAGEHGRGFAVVANEVRSLAERSKQSTAQVRTILNDIQKATNAVVMVTEEGTKGVEQGVKLVDRAGLTIRQLSDIIRENLNSTQQIMAVIQQQNVGVEQVAQAMTNINEVTNQNVAATRQLQQSVEGMNHLAERLNKLTGNYELDDNSNEPPRPLQLAGASR